ALAGAGAEDRRDAVRDAGADPRPRRHNPAGRAARRDHDRVRGPDARDLQRRAPADPHKGGRPGRRRADRQAHPRLSVMSSFLQAVIDGIGLGSVSAVVAVGIGLVFGVMRLVNLAYGELITAGAYTLAFLGGQPAVLAIAACFAVVIAGSLVMERVAFRPLRGASPATMLVTSFAISFLLQNIYLLSFGSRGSTVGTLGGLNTAIAIGAVRIRWIS